MRKITILVALIFISAISFAQVKKQKASGLKAVHVEKQINNMTNGAKVIVDSLHYDGDNADAVGAGAATYTAAAFFPAAILSAHNAVGNTITSVEVYINEIDSLTSSTLKFYSDQTTVVYSQAFTAVLGWQNVVLTTPLAIPTTDLYIGYEVVCTGGFACGFDGVAPANTNGDWILFNGTWGHLSAFGLDGNWNIRAMVSGTVLTTPVALVAPTTWAAGDVVVGNTTTSSTIALQNVGGGTLTVSGITGLTAPYTTTLVPATVSLTAGQSATFTFSFAPTAAGAANQTATIATNGGDVTVALTGNGVVCSNVTTFPWSEGFEGGALPSCWSLLDADGDTYNWGIVALTDGLTSHTGEYSISSASYSSVALTPDNYLITPKIEINSADLKLHFWAATQDIEWPSEHYSVMVSTTGTAAANFTEIFNETLTDTAYHQITLPLTSYNGQQIYVAFRHWNVSDMFKMKLDDISIDNLSGINEVANTNIVSVFPNPANDKLYIDAKNVNTVEIFNLTGAKVASFGNQSMINIADLAQGTYLVKVITNNKVSTQKINIVR